MRQITTHHDGHGLNESIEITADGPGPGGASHLYTFTMGGLSVAEVQFQNGPRNLPESEQGVTEGAILAMVIDRLKSFQEGEYKSRENAIALTHLETAVLWMKERTNARARRNVLGTMKV